MFITIALGNETLLFIYTVAFLRKLSVLFRLLSNLPPAHALPLLKNNKYVGCNRMI